MGAGRGQPPAADAPPAAGNAAPAAANDDPQRGGRGPGDGGGRNGGGNNWDGVEKLARIWARNILILITIFVLGNCFFEYIRHEENMMDKKNQQLAIQQGLPEVPRIHKEQPAIIFSTPEKTSPQSGAEQKQVVVQPQTSSNSSGRLPLCKAVDRNFEGKPIKLVVVNTGETCRMGSREKTGAGLYTLIDGSWKLKNCRVSWEDSVSGNDGSAENTLKAKSFLEKTNGCVEVSVTQGRMEMAFERKTTD
jgi:hypothetical protein